MAVEQGEIRSVASDSSSNQVASGGSDGTVKLWDAASARFVRQLGEPCPEDFACSINALAFDPKTPRLVTDATNGDVRIWELDGRAQSTVLPMRTPSDGPALQVRRVKGVAFSPDGSLIVAVGFDGVVRLWNAKNLQPIAESVAHAVDKQGQDVPYQVWSVAFNSDGTRWATGSGYALDGKNENFLQLWKVQPSTDHPPSRDGDPINDHPHWNIYSVAFDPASDHVASASYDGTVRVFDSEGNHQRRALLASEQDPVLTLAFAHDRHWLATGGADGKIRLWDTDTYQLIGLPLTGHTSWVTGMTFSWRDEHIVSGSANRTLRFWSSQLNAAYSICSKLVSNMSHKQRNYWISPHRLHQGLPGPANWARLTVAAESRTRTQPFSIARIPLTRSLCTGCASTFVG